MRRRTEAASSESLHPKSTFPSFVTKPSFRVLPLGQADRMLDMGFEPQIRKILVKWLGGKVSGEGGGNVGRSGTCPR